MNAAVEATAPGKLVLLGEYAVLEGAPAVVTAVARRARVRLRVTEAPGWRVTAPGLLDGPAEATVEAGGTLRWRDPEAGARLELLSGLVRAMAAAGLADPGRTPALELELDTTAFFQEALPGRHKLGLGSSAALTVALAVALAAAGGGEGVPAPEGGWLPALVRLHRAAQGGRGSGIDVAASLLGGIVRYRLGEGGRPEAAPAALPGGLGLRFVWTGRSAGTAGFLARLAAALESDRSGVRARLDTLADLARRGAAALTERAPEPFLGVVSAYGEAMAALGREAGIPILSPEHEALAALAAEAGVAYKPSGAGGGDLGVAFAADPAALDRFARLAASAGFAPLSLPLDRDGAVVDTVPA